MIALLCAVCLCLTARPVHAQSLHPVPDSLVQSTETAPSTSDSAATSASPQRAYAADEAHPKTQDAPYAQEAAADSGSAERGPAVTLHPVSSTPAPPVGKRAVPTERPQEVVQQPAADKIIASLSVHDVALKDVLRGIAARYDLNLIVDPGIRATVTARLSDVSVGEAVAFLCDEHGLRLLQQGRIWRVTLPPTKKAPFVVDVAADTLSVDLTEASVHDVARRLSEESRANVTVGVGVQGTVSGYLDAAPFDEGLAVLMENNGFALRREENIYTITMPPSQRGSSAGRRSRSVTVEGGRINLDVANAEVGAVIGDIARKMDLEVITYEMPDGRITARVSRLTLDDAFSYLLKGTSVTFRREGGRYVIGGKQTGGIASSKLIALEHIKAEHFEEALPQSLQQGTALQVITEQNAVVATGPSDAIREIETFAQEVDNPTPQILIEALVVDFEETGLFELAAEFQKGLIEEPSEQPEGSYRFDGDGYRLEANGAKTNQYLDGVYSALDHISSGIRNLGQVPPSFFFKIRALAREGKAEVLSRPQVSTLNGHTARISIGTTQYFILRGSTPAGAGPPGGSNYFPVEQERFEKIEANVTLEMTPFVSASGEVTVEVRPEISTPVGQFSAEVPPTINTRVIESTVRLRDGDTIILGGLVQDSKMTAQNKIPLLGQIPLLGRLFRNRSRDSRKSELVIYLTPHVFYGGDGESEKWDALREDMGLTAPEEASSDYSGGQD